MATSVLKPVESRPAFSTKAAAKWTGIKAR
jgi:hypothetical protein